MSDIEKPEDGQVTQPAEAEVVQVEGTEVVETAEVDAVDTTSAVEESNESEVPAPKTAKASTKSKAMSKIGQVVIHQKAPIVEPYDEENAPATFVPKTPLMTSNHTYDELETFFKKEYTRLSKLQDKRATLSRAEMDKEGIVRYQYGEDENNFLLVTEKEAETLYGIQFSIRTCSKNMHDKELFGPYDDATNAPVVGPEKMLTAISSPRSSATGQTAVSRIKSKLGLSVTRWVPLWTSGFRIHLKGPSVVELLNLDTQLILNKVESISNTFGYTLSSEGIYRDNVLINFILDHVIQSTTTTIDKTRLSRLISLPDYDAMVLGLAATMHPSGYPMERLIFRDAPEGVVGVPVKRRLNIWRMLVARQSLLTDEQKANVAKTSQGSVPEAEVLKHREGVRADIPKTVQLVEDVWVTLNIPSLEEYLRIGLNARSLMEESVNKVVMESENSEYRLAYLARISTLTRIRYLAHWVGGIRTTDTDGSMIEVTRVRDASASEEEVYAADMDIDSVLLDLVANDEAADKLVDAIEKYVNSVRISYAVLTREPNTQIGEGEHPMVITVDPAAIFFDLLRHKILMGGV